MPSEKHFASRAGHRGCTPGILSEPAVPMAESETCHETRSQLRDASAWSLAPVLCTLPCPRHSARQHNQYALAVAKSSTRHSKVPRLQVHFCHIPMQWALSAQCEFGCPRLAGYIEGIRFHQELLARLPHRSDFAIAARESPREMLSDLHWSPIATTRAQHWPPCCLLHQFICSRLHSLLCSFRRHSQFEPLLL